VRTAPDNREQLLQLDRWGDKAFACMNVLMLELFKERQAMAAHKLPECQSHHLCFMVESSGFGQRVDLLCQPIRQFDWQCFQWHTPSTYARASSAGEEPGGTGTAKGYPPDSSGSAFPVFSGCVRAARLYDYGLHHELGRVQHHLYIYSRIGSRTILPTDGFVATRR